MTLSAETLLEQACAATGLDDFGPLSYREGLESLIDAAQTEARLHEQGRTLLANMIRTRLQNRLALYDWHRRYPEISEGAVPEPVFIVGLWRTGTTILSYLLAQDCQRRSLLRWESGSPCPPPGLDPDADRERIRQTSLVISAEQRAHPRLAAINIQEADGPTECVLTLSHEFKSQLFDTCLHIPSFYRWNRSVDQRSAYEHHRATLQLLQWRRPPRRWHLKAPAHTLSLESLQQVYPDAKFVVVHRDPAVSLASACDFWELRMAPFTDHVRTALLGRQWLDIYTDALNALQRFLACTPKSSVIELQYAELRDPLRAVGRIYDHLSLPMAPETEARMAGALAEHRPGKHGRHDYSLERYGLDRLEVADRFAPFVDEMGIEQ